MRILLSRHKGILSRQSLVDRSNCFCFHNLSSRLVALPLTMVRATKNSSKGRDPPPPPKPKQSSRSQKAVSADSPSTTARKNRNPIRSYDSRGLPAAVQIKLLQAIENEGGLRAHSRVVANVVAKGDGEFGRLVGKHPNQKPNQLLVQVRNKVNDWKSLKDEEWEQTRLRVLNYKPSAKRQSLFASSSTTAKQTTNYRDTENSSSSPSSSSSSSSSGSNDISKDESPLKATNLSFAKMSFLYSPNSTPGKRGTPARGKNNKGQQQYDCKRDI